MPNRIVATEAAPKAIGPYSQAVKVERPAGVIVYCAGQIPLDPVTGALVEGDVRVQTERVLRNVEGVLAAAGLGLDDVVKTTVFLTDLADFAAMNEVYGAFFQGAYPARSTVPVPALPRGARVEIEVVAARDTPVRARKAARKSSSRPARRAARRGGRRA